MANSINLNDTITEIPPPPPKKNTGGFLLSAYSQNEPFSDSAGFKMVGARGFEPPTFCSQSRRTTRLCNAPLNLFRLCERILYHIFPVSSSRDTKKHEISDFIEFTILAFELRTSFSCFTLEPLRKKRIEELVLVVVAINQIFRHELSNRAAHRANV